MWLLHSVLYDKDGSENPEQNKKIGAAKNSHTHAIECFDKDFETEFSFLAKYKGKEAYRKPIQILEKWPEITKDENYKKVEEMIIELLPESKKNSAV